jgi:adenylosuccinate lyase
MRAWKQGLNFRELVTKDKKISQRVSPAQLSRAFSLKRQLRNVDKIFERVFGESTTKSSAKGRR